MNDLALISIGLGFGLALAVVTVLCVAMVWSAYKQREGTRIAQKYLTHLIAENTQALGLLRSEVTTALAKMDAGRLYSASVNLQRLVKNLGIQVDTIQKTVFAQPAIDFSGIGQQGTELDTEAEDDARMIAEANRWRQPAVGGTYPPYADPLGGLSEDEKRQRTLEYFERRRAAAAGFPYAPNLPSTPPTAGSGIYASLLEDAAQNPVPPPAVPDFSGIEPEEGIELSDKGELG